MQLIDNKLVLTSEECKIIKESDNTYYEDIQEILYINGHDKKIETIVKIVCDDKQLQDDLNNMIMEIK